MEESGQGDPYTEIIDRPELKSRLRLNLERAITIAFWGAYIYCLLPVFQVVLFSLGINSVPDRLVAGGSPLALIGLLKTAGAIGLIAAGFFVLWFLYNYLRFRLRGERTALRTADGENISRVSVDSNPLGETKEYDRIVIDVAMGEMACSSHIRLAVPQEKQRSMRARIERPFWIR
ncbi:MAG: hypothetical protein A4E57_02079 [Syntrophorhabdaceae bacterium PtaU1.Bin034]|jgi:poly-beta-1,6-N-acetyl-D-glucosamine biosynthesis protein PgaD|nr:MAG: hypothetical protein A4E57_02079 [Syntrophorhabdaceae bacterium PtaU1.Bin034]